MRIEKVAARRPRAASSNAETAAGGGTEAAAAATPVDAAAGALGAEEDLAAGSAARASRRNPVSRSRGSDGSSRVRSGGRRVRSGEDPPGVVGHGAARPRGLRPRGVYRGRPAAAKSGSRRRRWRAVRPRAGVRPTRSRRAPQPPRPEGHPPHRHHASRPPGSPVRDHFACRVRPHHPASPPSRPVAGSTRSTSAHRTNRPARPKRNLLPPARRGCDPRGRGGDLRRDRRHGVSTRFATGATAASAARVAATTCVVTGATASSTRFATGATAASAARVAATTCVVTGATAHRRASPPAPPPRQPR